MDSNNISVVGLGKVGITLAANLADSGKQVFGYDLSEKLISDITDFKFKSNEPLVEEKVYDNLNKSFFVTSDINKAILNTDISFVIVPTPSNSSGGFTNKYILKACEMIGATLPNKKTRHTIALVSTVIPGSNNSQIIPCIERASGLKVGVDFGYCYNPAFIALGEIVKGFCNPDFVLLGEYDVQSGDTILDAIKSMHTSKPPISRMTLIEAELTKIASNTHDTMRVAFANTLMNICTEVPNTNVDVITGALSNRLGKKFFRGATPYGGPCWPRDNVALSEFMKLFKSSSILPESVHLSNLKIGEYLLEKINAICEPNSRIGIIGLAYKDGTSIIDESFAIKLFLGMLKKGHKVIGWDPLVSKEDLLKKDKKIELSNSIDECIEKSEVIIITNQSKEANLYDWKKNKVNLVIDCWRCLLEHNKKYINRYFGLGLNNNQNVNEWILKDLGKDFIKLTE